MYLSSMMIKCKDVSKCRTFCYLGHAIIHVWSVVMCPFYLCPSPFSFLLWIWVLYAREVRAREQRWWKFKSKMLCSFVWKFKLKMLCSFVWTISDTIVFSIHVVLHAEDVVTVDFGYLHQDWWIPLRLLAASDREVLKIVICGIQVHCTYSKLNLQSFQFSRSWSGHVGWYMRLSVGLDFTVFQMLACCGLVSLVFLPDCH